MDLRRALETYTVLTIGDGLVTVIPALMISISGGLIVTRASSETNLGLDFRSRCSANPQPLMLAAGVLMAMAAVSGASQDSVSGAGRGVGYDGVALAAKSCRCRKSEARGCRRRRAKIWKSLLRVEPLAVEVGLGLVQSGRGRAEFAAAQDESPASGGSWPPNSDISCRPCASPTI